MAQPTELDWRRPHPLTIVVEVGRAIQSVILVIVVFGGGFLEIGSILEMLLIWLPLVAALGRWYTTRYALGSEAVHHHHGLIWRKKTVLPRANVQNVSTTAGLIARMGSVVELQISDASATGDINLRYLPKAEADRLATILRADASTHTPAVDGPPDPALPDPAFAAPPGAPPAGSPPPGPAPPGTTPTPAGAPAPPGSPSPTPTPPSTTPTLAGTAPEPDSPGTATTPATARTSAATTAPDTTATTPVAELTADASTTPTAERSAGTTPTTPAAERSAGTAPTTPAAVRSAGTAPTTPVDGVGGGASTAPVAERPDGIAANAPVAGPGAGAPATGWVGGGTRADEAMGPGGGPSPAAGGQLGTAGGAAAPEVGTAVEREPLVSPALPLLIKAEVTTVSTILVLGAAAIWAIVGPILVTAGALDTVTDGAARWLLGGLGGLFLASFALVSIVQRTTVVGGYRLYADPDRLRIQAGLLTEAKIAAKRERIQLIRVDRQLPHRWLGIERVAYETADVQAGGTPATGMLAPVAETGAWRALAEEAIGPIQLGESDLRPVSPLARRRTRTRFAIAALPLLAVAFLNVAAAAALIVALLAVGWWYGHHRFARLGWAVSGDQYLVRRGVVLSRLTLVRLDKIQSLRVVSSVFQRRLDLATVEVSTAGRGFRGLVSLPDLPRPDAVRLHDELANRAASTPIGETL